jgi:hypothetical protein
MNKYGINEWVANICNYLRIDRTVGTVCIVNYWHVGVQEGFDGHRASKLCSNLILSDCTLALILESSARIYRPSFGHENARFRENMRKTLVFNSIRTQRRRFQLVLDEIRLGGSFQILGLRRVRDQLVFMHRTKQSQVVSEKWAG